ncbi:unnamed protein product [Closterium sp. NIES-64]|nr:unnamed protein product [Closterium sp. NIES-64]
MRTTPPEAHVSDAAEVVVAPMTVGDSRTGGGRRQFISEPRGSLLIAGKQQPLRPSSMAVDGGIYGGGVGGGSGGASTTSTRAICSSPRVVEGQAYEWRQSSTSALHVASSAASTSSVDTRGIRDVAGVLPPRETARVSSRGSQVEVPPAMSSSAFSACLLRSSFAYYSAPFTTAPVPSAPLAIPPPTPAAVRRGGGGRWEGTGQEGVSRPVEWCREGRCACASACRRESEGEWGAGRGSGCTHARGWRGVAGRGERVRLQQGKVGMHSEKGGLWEGGGGGGDESELLRCLKSGDESGEKGSEVEERGDQQGAMQAGACLTASASASASALASTSLSTAIATPILCWIGEHGREGDEQHEQQRGEEDRSCDGVVNQGAAAEEWQAREGISEAHQGWTAGGLGNQGGPFMPCKQLPGACSMGSASARGMKAHVMSSWLMDGAGASFSAPTADPAAAHAAIFPPPPEGGAAAPVAIPTDLLLPHDQPQQPWCPCSSEFPQTHTPCLLLVMCWERQQQQQQQQQQQLCRTVLRSIRGACLYVLYVPSLLTAFSS